MTWGSDITTVQCVHKILINYHNWGVFVLGSMKTLYCIGPGKLHLLSLAKLGLILLENIILEWTTSRVT